jgi:hypothetical protein
VGYNVAAYSVRPMLWRGIRDRGGWMRRWATQARKANRFDFDVSIALSQMTSAAAAKRMAATGGYDQPHHVYWYALLLLAEVDGRWLGSRHWTGMPRPFEFRDEVVQALAAAGFADAAKVVDAVFTDRPPVDLPGPAAFPAVGYLAADAMPDALAALEAADLPAGEQSDAVAETAGWIRTCQTAEDQRDLLTFVF